MKGNKDHLENEITQKCAMGHFGLRLELSVKGHQGEIDSLGTYLVSGAGDYNFAEKDSSPQSF